jgi:serine/threonine-protein kinase
VSPRASSIAIRSKRPDVRTSVPLSRYVEGEIIADKYKLMCQLGAGGMGSLWMAKNLQLDAFVALKLIRADVASKEADERFITEARTLARLRHPNIVRVFDFGRTRHEDPYIVMELLQGETLGGRLDRTARLAPAQALQLILPIVDALVAAHAKGVMHRDIKPENVFLADDDGRLQPKLLDFGIAKTTTGLDERRLTRTGTVVGSPEYLSPEQARGSENIDFRTDIWSLSVVIYECLTGQLPFDGSNYNSLLRSIIEDEPAALTELGAGDAELWKLLRAGLAKKPEHRYRRTRDFGIALASWLYAHGIQEDACGQSLRAAWLEAGGEKRAIPTPPAGRTRSTIPAAKVFVEAPRRRAKVGLGIGALALASVIGVAWNASSDESAVTVAEASPKITRAARSVSTIEALPARPVAVTEIPPLKLPEKNTARPRRMRAEPKPVASKPAAPPPPPAPPKAFTEDLGF